MSKQFKAFGLFLSALAVFGTLSYAAATKQAVVDKAKKTPVGGDVFFVFHERGSRLNHYAPSGWMGDYSDLHINMGWIKDVAKPKGAKAAAKKAAVADVDADKDETSMQFKYTAERKQGAGWAGVYWQHPANNWGDKRGGYDLSGYTKLVFWAKGEKGGEVVDKFFIGGITGQTEEGDTDEASISPVQLTKDWKEYSIPLTGLDLSHIIGGFGFAINADSNPNGATLFLDEVRFEK